MCMHGDRSCVSVRRMREKRLMGRMHVDLEVMRELDGPSGVVKVEIDTGSDDSALPRPFLKKLGIRPVGWEWNELADGRKIRRQYGIAFLRLMGQVGASRVIFARPKDPPLLGRIALAQLGFELEPKRAILRKYPRRLISIRRPRATAG